MHDSNTLAIYYEHPDWFRLLFAELDRRKVPYVTLDARRHSYHPGKNEKSHDVVFNRMSPSVRCSITTSTPFQTSSLTQHA